MKSKTKLLLTIALIAPILCGCLKVNPGVSSELNSTSEFLSSENTTTSEKSYSSFSSELSSTTISSNTSQDKSSSQMTSSSSSSYSSEVTSSNFSSVSSETTSEATSNTTSNNVSSESSSSSTTSESTSLSTIISSIFSSDIPSSEFSSISTSESLSNTSSYDTTNEQNTSSMSTSINSTTNSSLENISSEEESLESNFESSLEDISSSSEFTSEISSTTISSNSSEEELSSEMTSSSSSNYSSEVISSNSSSVSSETTSEATSNTTSNNVSSESSSSSTTSEINSSSILIDEEETIILNSNNKPTTSNSLSSVSKTIEDKTFIYQRAKNASGHVFLGKTGSITNSESSPLGEILSFTINYDVITNSNVKLQNTNGFGYLKYRVSNNYIDNVNDYSVDIKTIGRDYTVSFEGDYPSYLSFYTPREVVINSLSITYKDVEYARDNGNFDIQVFATNDIHGQVKETTSYPGLSKLTSKMKSVASTKDQYNIFLDQGDIYQGTAEAGLANGLNMDDFLVQNGYESVVLGNHEFDWGEQKLIDHDNYLDTTILANNIRYSSNGQSPSYCEPYKLISRNGVKIGIIGSIGNVYSSISSSKVKGIYFLYGDNLTEQIKKDSQTLKDMGAEFIILSLHDGENSTSNGTSSLSYYDVQALSGTYVDLVLEGHSHQSYSFYDSKGVWHIQNRGNGASFSVATLNCTYNALSDDYEVSMSTSSSAVTRYSSFSSEDEVMSEVDSWYEEYVYGSIQSEVVGRSVPYMRSSIIKSTLSKLYYEIGIELVGENNTYTPVLGGGFISTRTPYNLSAGTVKYGDIYALLPFENDIVLCSIKGTYLLSKFINSTNSNYYVYSMIDASEVNSDETYYIITDSYSSDYKSNNLTVVKNLTLEYGVGYARDLFAEYLKDNYL